MHFALSPDQNKSLVRWPPDHYEFDGTIYAGMPADSDCHVEGGRLKGLYPEIEHWSDNQRFLAWERYGEDTSWGSQPRPTERDEYFIAYLYANQELEFDHGGLDELNPLWAALDQ